MSKTKRIVGPFTSEFGTFNPGDAAIAVTVCTGRTCVDRVEYVGYVERNQYNWKTKEYEAMKFAQIRRPSEQLEWYNKTTGEACNWSRDENISHRYITKHIVTTLQYNRLLPAVTDTDGLIKAI